MPFDEKWSLFVDGSGVPAREACGVTTAYDVRRAGTAVLEYRSPASRTVSLVVQAALWVLVLVAALVLFTFLVAAALTAYIVEQSS